MYSSYDERLDRVRCSLEGLSVGDALGRQFFGDRDKALQRILTRSLPPAPWAFSDDTQMALSIVSNLRQHGTIEQNSLAASFANRYDGARAYGPSMHYQLRNIRAGQPWKEQAASQFSGQGSYGNGAAMRVAPLGAFFADDIESVIEQAQRSAEVTHMHHEGIVGAIAVAVAAAWAGRLHLYGERPTREAFLDLILPSIPESEVRTGIHYARNLSEQVGAEQAAAVLGNGSRVSAQDTIPFALWCAGEHLGKYEDAMWQTLQVYGDIDTNCAIVGGIVSLFTGTEQIPPLWLESREALPDWPFIEREL